MRREALCLRDIVEAADAVGRFVADTTEDEFAGDEVLRSAVLQKLTVIGEAASRLSRDFRAAHPSIPWADIIAFRNIAVHAYFSVDWSIVWVAATEDAPRLRRQLAEILESG
ncbi:MAG: DUF86 domain-containing protein [Planctomycetes bacterium]|nr:DUF86 domain-containing protein [Planctomycetota bacterium]